MVYFNLGHGLTTEQILNLISINCYLLTVEQINLLKSLFTEKELSTRQSYQTMHVLHLPAKFSPTDFL